MIHKARGWFNRVVHKIDATNIPKRVLEVNGKSIYPANCWGATIMYHQDILPKYIDRPEMEEWLRDNTIPAKEPKSGMILVMRDGDVLVHTAVFVDYRILWHKRGTGGRWEFISLRDLKQVYWEVNVMEIREFKLNRESL